MSKNPNISDQIDYYINEIVTKQTPVQQRLREETATMIGSIMQITPDEGAFLSMLVRLLGAKHIIEIGTFTGYSALCMAAALPEGGKLVACDINKSSTDIAEKYWREAGVMERIQLEIGPADKTLARLLSEGFAGHFDLAFIDADKIGYDDYYEACLKLLKSGGAIALDNMLWGGAVADPSVQDADTSALRNLNAKIRDDSRVDCCLLTIADGVMLVRKK